MKLRTLEDATRFDRQLDPVQHLGNMLAFSEPEAKRPSLGNRTTYMVCGSKEACVFGVENMNRLDTDGRV